MARHIFIERPVAKAELGIVPVAAREILEFAEDKKTPRSSFVVVILKE